MKNPRQVANLEILRQLTHYVKMNPDIRFNQMLVNMNITVDTAPRFYNPAEDFHPPRNEVFYHEESTVTLERIKQVKKERLSEAMEHVLKKYSDPEKYKAQFDYNKPKKRGRPKKV